MIAHKEGGKRWNHGFRLYLRSLAQFLHLLGCGPICKEGAKDVKTEMLIDWHMTGSCILNVVY